MNIQFPFVGREKEIARLRQLHEQRRHVLLLGAEGTGKSAIIAQLRDSFGLRLCPHSEHLSDICESLEREFGLEAGGLHLVKRKNRVLKLLEEARRAVVVFDGASWTTPRLGSFIENVSARVPVWLCARSKHPWDIGRIWPLLVRFEHIELKPFYPAESRLLVEASIRDGLVPKNTLDIVDWLHRRAAGNPNILCELLTEIVHGHYDLSRPHGLQLLDLDRRIHEMFPTASMTEPTANE